MELFGFDFRNWCVLCCEPMRAPEPPADAPVRGTSPRRTAPPTTLLHRSLDVDGGPRGARRVAYVPEKQEGELVNTGLNIEQATSGACSTLRPVFSGDIKMAAHKDAQNIERQLHHEMQSLERELHNVAVHCRQLQEKKNKKGGGLTVQESKEYDSDRQRAHQMLKTMEELKENHKQAKKNVELTEVPRNVMSPGVFVTHGKHRGASPSRVSNNTHSQFGDLRSSQENGDDDHQQQQGGATLKGPRRQSISPERGRSPGLASLHHRSHDVGQLGGSLPHILPRASAPMQSPERRTSPHRASAPTQSSERHTSPHRASAPTQSPERRTLPHRASAPTQGEIEHDARVVKSREAWDNLSKDECGYPMDMEDAHPPPRTIEHQTRETLSQFNYE